MTNDSYKAKTLIMQWYIPVLAWLGKGVRLLATSQRLYPKWLLAQLLLHERVDNSYYRMQCINLMNV
jgi:hypothetical protein